MLRFVAIGPKERKSLSFSLKQGGMVAEAPRFELGLGQYPTVGFQDRSLQPLGYASALEMIFRFRPVNVNKNKTARIGVP